MKRQKAAMIKMIPKTLYNQHREPKRMHGGLTIKLNRVMRHRLDQAPTGPFLLSIASFASFAVHVEHKSHRRHAASHKDDEESPKCPTPAGAFQEYVNKLGSREGRSDPRCLIDAENDHAVFQRGDVSAHDIDNVDEADVTSPVKNVATDIRLDVRADSLDVIPRTQIKSIMQKPSTRPQRSMTFAMVSGTQPPSAVEITVPTVSKPWDPKADVMYGLRPESM
jgi:hypothetical protein